MKLAQKSIEHLAHLARLSLDNQDHIREDLVRITNMIEQITLVNTEGVEPMAHPSHSVQRLREDIVSEPDQSAAFAALAPSVEAGLFLVPTVLE